MRLERKSCVTDMLSPLKTPLSFTCKLGECRSELMSLLSEVSKVVSTEGGSFQNPQTGSAIDAKTHAGDPRDDHAVRHQ